MDNEFELVMEYCSLMWLLLCMGADSVLDSYEEQEFWID